MQFAVKCSIFIIFLIALTNLIFAARTTLLRERHDARKQLRGGGERQKRWLVFPPNGGTAKYVAGYLGPIDTPKFINCNAIRNFQYQYDLPNNLSVIYQKYADWTKPKARNFDGSSNTIVNEASPPKPDSSRRIAYELVEEILSKEGKNGRQCLLRTICEIAETPLTHNGLIGELLELFFTPGKHENIHDDYRDARKAGLHHVDCVRLYPDCPFGDGILDTFSVIREFKFGNIFAGLMK